MTRARTHGSSVIRMLILFAMALAGAERSACAQEDSGPKGLQVYWHDAIGPQTTLDGVDWAAPDRLTGAYRVDWASTSAPWEPDAPADQFGVRIVGTIRAHADGEYHFRLSSDEGSRLYLNEDLLIDHDGVHAMTSQQVTIELEAAYHPIEILYFENSGPAGLHLEWRPPGQTGWVTVPASAFAALDAPIEADWYYTDHAINRFEDVDWSAPTLNTSEREINWPDHSSGFLPDSPADRFALRARSRLVIPESGIYRFELGSDDGSRLTIDGEIIIDRNGPQGFRWESQSVYLTEGTRSIEVLYFENSGQAGLVLMWQPPSAPSPTVIPEAAFESPAGTARPRIIRWTEQARLAEERDAPE